MEIKFSELVTVRQSHVSARVAYTAGCFDILHQGHLGLLSSLRDAADITVIGITPDTKVSQKKGYSRPVQDQETRLAVINALRAVDYALITPQYPLPGHRFVGESVLRSLRPNLLLTNDQAWENDRSWLEGQGTELKYVGVHSELGSTTQIITSFLSRLGIERPE